MWYKKWPSIIIIMNGMTAFWIYYSIRQSKDNQIDSGRWFPQASFTFDYVTCKFFACIVYISAYTDRNLLVFNEWIRLTAQSIHSLKCAFTGYQMHIWAILFNFSNKIFGDYELSTNIQLFVFNCSIFSFNLLPNSSPLLFYNWNWDL